MEWPEQLPSPMKDFCWLRVPFRMRALAPTQLPPYLGSTLRGGLAMAFKRMHCSFGLRSCDGCPVQTTCPYPRAFETTHASGTQDIRRLRDIPHPVLVEPPIRHPGHFQPGDSFQFELVMLGRGCELLPQFCLAVAAMAREGLGVQRRPFALELPEQTAEGPVYNSRNEQLEGDLNPQRLADEVAGLHRSARLRVQVTTPLRIKHEGSLLKRDSTIEVLLSTGCRRLWGLLVNHHGIEPDDIDFRPLLATRLPVVVENQWRWQKLARYSNRQQSEVRLDGLTGSMTLGEVTPAWQVILRALEVAHVGKAAVMGLGRLIVQTGPGGRQRLPLRRRSTPGCPGSAKTAQERNSL